MTHEDFHSKTLILLVDAAVVFIFHLMEIVEPFWMQ